MGKRSIFGLEPDQLDQLLSLGTDAEDPPLDHTQEAKAQECQGAVGDAKSVQESPREDMRAMRNPAIAPLVGPEGIGHRIGPYKLVRVLGEGGMGMVYLAEQEGALSREVALKVVKPGMASKRVIARLEAERQALALLDHPNIAHVYDAGTTGGGRPYFVMEHVEGLPITQYCDRHRLTVENRLRLFQQVCLAVHHAHQKGIIHRDLKPSNILISAENDRPTPKIIDFGVAKAMGQPLTERTFYTEDSHLLGTPEYMSPEQAEMVNEDIDIRSDIYSLGVLLYVLLTGVLPFDSDTLRTGGMEHIRQVIRGTDPKTPSTRVARLGDEARKVAERRCTQVGTLARRLRKELEWIPLKAMRKARAERYRSASELADDIDNYLKGVPLIAGPSGSGYRLKKFVRRNRVLVGGIAAVLVVLVAGVVVSTVFAIGQARALADNRLIVDFLTSDVLGPAADANVGEATVSYLLDAGSKRLGDKLKDRPLIEAEIREKLAWTYRQIGELDKAEQHFLRAIELYRQHRGEEHPDTLRATFDIGWVYRDKGRHREMERLWTENLQIIQRVCPVKDQLHAMNALGVAYMVDGKHKEAEALFEKMLYLDQRELQGEYTRSAPWRRGNLAIVYLCRGRYDEAERLLKETIRTTESPEDSADAVLGLKRSLAVTYGAQGRYDKAEELLDETLKAFRLLRGDKHRATLSCTLYLAQLHMDQERYDEADDLLREALPIARERLRQGHPLTLRFVNALAVLHTKQGDYAEAEALFDEVLKGRRNELGDDHPDTLQTISDFGVLRREQQRYAEAELLPLKAFHGRETKLGPEHPHTVDSLKQLVNLYESWSKPDEGEKWRARLPDINSAEE